MSQENVEIMRRGYAAFAEKGVEGVIPFFTEDAVIYSIPEWPDDPEYHGHDGLRKLTRQWTANFDAFGFDIRELRDGGDSVIALYELVGQTKDSAMPMSMQIGAVSEFRDGRVARQRLFSNWESALEAAGLSE
ncbi:MAG TPA: nuclear transport factor 2 family protein [Solirubrobacterales bacterium]|nr:nuclear transport factor 2 family protein [Solirubrobacterales bacterium]